MKRHFLSPTRACLSKHVYHKKYPNHRNSTELRQKIPEGCLIFAQLGVLQVLEL
jgi:hypothetical protein